MKAKKLFLLLIVLIFGSCNRTPEEPKIDTAATTREFAKTKIAGKYSVAKQMSDIPVDLNLDGIANTDLSKEFTCVWGNYEYSTRMIFDGLNENENACFKVEAVVLYNVVDYNREPAEQGCFNYWVKYYQYEMTSISPATFEFEFYYNKGGREHYWEELFGVPKNLSWQNDTLYFEFQKDFYTSDGWQTVNCNFEFVKTE
ncbi:MAG: hypothetical protein LBN95_09635 [Prevotellaceae bacterium]|jgi:hypothetical protein|nr:hypothetical protein [Prevotellaceae bacterium]